MCLYWAERGVCSVCNVMYVGSSGGPDRLACGARIGVWNREEGGKEGLPTGSSLGDWVLLSVEAIALGWQRVTAMPGIRSRVV